MPPHSSTTGRAPAGGTDDPALTWTRQLLRRNVVGVLVGSALVVSLLATDVAVSPRASAGASLPWVWAALMLSLTVLWVRVCFCAAGVVAVATRGSAGTAGWACVAIGSALGAVTTGQALRTALSRGSDISAALSPGVLIPFSLLVASSVGCAAVTLWWCRQVPTSSSSTSSSSTSSSSTTRSSTVGGSGATLPTPRASAFSIPHEPPVDVAVVCSGGGIRSASFCLGALQALTSTALHRQVDLVVGVSGGGYAATTFVEAQREGSPRPFAPDSPELRRLRCRTRYLASSPGVILAGVAHLLWGLITNVVVVWAALQIVGVLVGWQAAHAGLVTAGKGMLASLPHSIVLQAIAPGAVAVLMYALPFVGAKAVLAFPPLRKARGSVGRWSAASTNLLGPAATPRWWLGLGVITSSVLVVLPLSGLSIAHASQASDGWSGWVAGLVVGGGPVAHGDTSLSHVDWGGLLKSVGEGVGGLVALAGLLRSSQKGRLARVDAGDSTWGTIVSGFRRAVAPALANAVAVVGGLIILIRASVVTMQDQLDGWAVVRVVAAGGLLWVASEANLSSLLGFYRDRLRSAWLPTTDGDLQPRGGAVPPRPDLVLLTTANVSDPDAVPSGRAGTPFVLGTVACGFTDGHLPTRPTLVRTETFVSTCGLDLDLATAMAISGSAVSPLSGRGDAAVRPFRVLMTILNLRMGAWVVNPQWAGLVLEGRLGWLTQRWLAGDLTSPWYSVNEALGRASLSAPRIFLTDGGHFDNLGLTEALRRDASTVIVLDGTQEPPNSFLGLGQSLASARMDHGIETEALDLSGMTGDESGRVERAWTTFVVRRPAGGRPCTVLYLKALMTRSAPLELTAYQAEHPDFPVTPTVKQLYDEFDFEAYRLLGEVVAGDALAQDSVSRMFERPTPP